MSRFKVELAEQRLARFAYGRVWLRCNGSKAFQSHLQAQMTTTIYDGINWGYECSDMKLLVFLSILSRVISFQ